MPEIENSTGPAELAELRSADLTALFCAAPDNRDHDGIREFITDACALGLHLLFVHPDSKVPADMRTPAVRSADDRAAQDAARAAGQPGWWRKKSDSGLKLATNDTDTLLAYLDRYIEAHGPDVAVNLGVHLGRSGLVVVDCDTPAQVAAYAATDAEGPTVSTPGQIRLDGTMAHSDGGHWYFTVAADAELPDGFSGFKVKDDEYVVLTGDKYALIPPSTRPEGGYACVGQARVLPDRLRLSIVERGRVRRAGGERSRVPSGDDPIAVLGQTRPWDTILGLVPGWVNTGKPDTCGCDIWTAPGVHASPKSATAHEPPGCEYFSSDDPPLHIWTDNPGEPFDSLIAAQTRAADKTVTRLEAITAIEYDGEMAEAIDAITADMTFDPAGTEELLTPADAGDGIDAGDDGIDAGDGIDADELDAAGPIDFDSLADMAAIQNNEDVATSISKGAFTDDQLARKCAQRVLRGKFISVVGLGWLRWTGTHWDECTSAPASLAWRNFAVKRMLEASKALSRDTNNRQLKARFEGWKSALSKSRLTSVVALAAEQVELDARLLDADPDVLNTPAGIVHLPTGELLPHDPKALCSKITVGSYRLNEDGTPFTHPDVDMLLEALDAAEREYLQHRIGQAITGYKTTDGVIPVCQGSGENGKTAIFDGSLESLGTYGWLASPRLFTADKNNDHSTERADLRGKRFVVGEELTEGRSLDVTALKRITDVSRITARKLYRDNLSFPAVHSLFLLTNHEPVIRETDHGTWRRLVLLKFPYTFRKEGEPLRGKGDKRGEFGLKERVKANKDGQLDAMLTWAITGAREWYARPDASLAPTPTVNADTLAWRTNSDHILGFWNECLVTDRNGRVVATTLYAEFTRWLDGSGHQAWSDQLFTSRLAQHDNAISARLEKRQVRTANLNLSYPASELTQARMPNTAMVWHGVRFRTAADVAANDLAAAPHPQPADPDMEETIAELA